MFNEIAFFVAIPLRLKFCVGLA